jgi:flagellar basal-body rod modification protein FlgD
VEVDKDVDALQIDIRDSSGKVIQSYSQKDGVDAGVIPMPWDGTKADGSIAKDGNYSIKVTAYRDGKDVSTDVKALSLGIVNSVSNGPGGLKINTTFGQVNLSDIKTVL